MLLNGVHNTRSAVQGERVSQHTYVGITFANLYRAKGEFKRAAEMFEAHIAAESEVTADRIHAAANRRRLGLMYEELGDLGGAEKLLVEPCGTSVELYGEKSPETSKCMDHINRVRGTRVSALPQTGDETRI